MDAGSASAGEMKPVCQCPGSRSGAQRWIPGLPGALCLLLCLSSVTVCLLMSVRTQQLEQRLEMEMNKVFQPPHRALLTEDGSLIPELSSPIGRLLEEVQQVCGVFRQSCSDGHRDSFCEPLTASSEAELFTNTNLALSLAIVP